MGNLKKRKAYFTGLVTRRAVRRNKGGDRNDTSVGEQSRDLADASQVLLAILFGKAQARVQSETNIVAIQAVRVDPHLQQTLFQSSRNRGLARPAVASEKKKVALVPRSEH